MSRDTQTKRNEEVLKYKEENLIVEDQMEEVVISINEIEMIDTEAKNQQVKIVFKQPQDLSDFEKLQLKVQRLNEMSKLKTANLIQRKVIMPVSHDELLEFAEFPQKSKMRFGCTLAFFAGAGLPGLAFFTGELINANYAGVSPARYDKTMMQTFGLLEAVGCSSTIFSMAAWQILNGFAKQQAAIIQSKLLETGIMTGKTLDTKIMADNAETLVRVLGED